MLELPILNNAPEPARTATGRLRLPPWLRVNLPKGQGQGIYNATASTIGENALHTVCEEARCPNIHDCWSHGTATFMIAGKECTRGCRFCSVETLKAPTPPEIDEPQHLADAVVRMGLEHAVITVVNRDDMPDGGAGHYRKCIDAVRAASPKTTIELLCSDLAGNETALADLLDAALLDVFAHNVECVERIEKNVRDPRASFELSLKMLRIAKRLRPDIATKSSLMVGLGETDAEVTEALKRLQEAGVQLLTIGQYLAPGLPGERFLPVDRFVPPEQFEAWEAEALAMGFAGAACGPLVRSSYRAGELLAKMKCESKALAPG